jgi:hypothetical protein
VVGLLTGVTPWPTVRPLSRDRRSGLGLPGLLSDRLGQWSSRCYTKEPFLLQSAAPPVPFPAFRRRRVCSYSGLLSACYGLLDGEQSLLPTALGRRNRSSVTPMRRRGFPHGRMTVLPQSVLASRALPGPSQLGNPNTSTRTFGQHLRSARHSSPTIAYRSAWRCPVATRRSAALLSSCARHARSSDKRAYLPLRIATAHQACA